jgi:capsid portal protein
MDHMTEPKKPDQSVQVAIKHATYNLFGSKVGDGILNIITDTPDKDAKKVYSNTTKKGVTTYPHPVNIGAVYALKDISGHHSSCIQSKKYATVGLGFIDSADNVQQAADDQQAMEMMKSLLSGQGSVESKVDEELDPLTYFGFMHELLKVAEDFMDAGTGYMEVVRDGDDGLGEIKGLKQVPAMDIWPMTYDGRLFYRYQSVSTSNGQTKYFAPFGKSNKEWLMSKDGPFEANSQEGSKVSEIITFICPSNRVEYQGYPDWLSASVDIDLLRKSKQYKADFYHNRGVIDKIVAVTGERVDPDAWKTIVAAIQGTVGEGNNFGTVALNLGKEGAAIQVENLGAEEGNEDQFAKDVETLTQNIVSSHRVPPLLANILIPGKLGASNEFINALIGFQLLVINPYQNVFEKMLAKTLGGPDGIDTLNPDDFRLRTITSQIDLNTMDTVGRMRSEAMSGENAGRDLSDGVED